MTEDDRELLVLAAKAAGLSIVGWDDEGSPLIYFDQLRPWNPLRNLDQAKNLRHRLHLLTGFDDRFSSLGYCAYATYSTGEYYGIPTCNSIMQNVESAGGKREALRRAITRAAAEIGRAKQEVDHD